MLLDKEQLAAREALDALQARISGGEVGGGIYLWGSVGRGKTMLMGRVLRQAPGRQAAHSLSSVLCRSALSGA